jgi:adenine-specific DNA-methyltransferase
VASAPSLSAASRQAIDPDALIDRVDLLRLDSNRRLDPNRKAEFAQFFSPSAIARLMGSMLALDEPVVNILDAGAGVGSLFSAVVAELCRRPDTPREITVTAYELDNLLIPYLEETISLCAMTCERAGIVFRGQIYQEDFISSTVEMLRPSLFSSRQLPPINCVVLNPPYLKIHSQSRVRELLRQLGVETSNLYTAFMAASIRLLQSGGEFVAITPRSFCNGPYFRPFRQEFLETMALRRLHVFDSRQQAFRDDQVLQENVIVYAVKESVQPRTVAITASEGPEDEASTWRDVAFESVVDPDDPQAFIRVIADELEGRIAERMRHFTSSLADLGMTVSTGRVVDFRASEHLRWEPEEGTAPLIYPAHFERGGIKWPKENCRKANAITRNDHTEDLLIPAGNYVLVKRFSAKEERRRVVAAVITPEDITGDAVAFENHLNYFHRRGTGLDLALARGLSAFLNSTLVDAYFRQFNGHTQVNATDLRSLRYPEGDELRDLGALLGTSNLTQAELDQLIETRLLEMAGTSGVDPVQAKQRIGEAVTILKDLGLPRAQHNDRSALVLLALLDLTADRPWSDAQAPLRGVTNIMDYVAEHYGRRYAPNTRETFRRFTLHQFVDAGLVVTNPDKPDRPTNSPDWVYQIEQSALELLRTYGSDDWDHNLRAYLATTETLRTRYAQERVMQQIPVVTTSGDAFMLSPGGQNVLVKAIIEEFAPRFIPGGRVLYVGDTAEKYAVYEPEALAELGVAIDAHGKMPDVVIHHTERNWLVLIEAVTSHGPVNPKRRAELEDLFSGSTAGLVFVTAFLTRKALAEYLDDISWRTEVWAADYPSHLIHFDGERFLGPY